MTVSDEVIKFYEDFSVQSSLPDDISVHNPFDDFNKHRAMVEFCNKYYSDDKDRIHVLGINPSRFTETSTGVNYTDGYALDNYCGIDNNFSKTRELTSKFFYNVVEAMGGASQFYKNVFAWAVMPLSVTKKGEYKNYYEQDVFASVINIVLGNLEWLRSSIPSTGRLIILGSGDNRKTIDQLTGFPFGYTHIEYLPHPRWIMQYNSKMLNKYVDLYVQALS